MTDLNAAAKEIMADLDILSSTAPHAGAAFSMLMASIGKVSPGSPGMRALTGAALGVSARCEACARLHAHDAARAGVSRAAIKLALQRGVLMARGPAGIYAAQALVDFDEACAGTRKKASKPLAEARKSPRPRKPFVHKQVSPTGVAPAAYTLDHQPRHDGARR